MLISKRRQIFQPATVPLLLATEEEVISLVAARVVLVLVLVVAILHSAAPPLALMVESIQFLKKATLA